jgi:hypothetical protein
MSLRYPSAWTRVDWSCQAMMEVTPIAVLTNARPAPKCPGPTFRGGYSFPPHQRLGPDVVSIALMDGIGLGVKPKWNTQIDGRPAHIWRPAQVRASESSFTSCAAGGPSEYRAAMIDTPRGRLLGVHAAICGPDVAAGTAAVNKVIASLRFTR